MKNVLILTTILRLLFSCSADRKQQMIYLSSGIEKIKIFPATERDSVKIDSIDLAGKKFSEKCRREYVNCIDDSGIMTLYAEFPNGIHNFRTVLFDHFKASQNTGAGENRIRVTIGTQDNLEKVEVLKYTDKDTKKATEDVFKLKELKTWKSAKIYGIPVKEQFEISIFIKAKNKTGKLPKFWTASLLKTHHERFIFKNHFHFGYSIRNILPFPNGNCPGYCKRFLKDQQCYWYCNKRYDQKIQR